MRISDWSSDVCSSDLVARAALADRLGREHMFDLRGSDPERERPERAVRRGVAVAADDRHSRLRTPLLGSDNMDDPAARTAHREILDPETARIFDQCFELREIGRASCRERVCQYV